MHREGRRCAAVLGAYRLMRSPSAGDRSAPGTTSAGRWQRHRVSPQPLPTWALALLDRFVIIEVMGV